MKKIHFLFLLGLYSAVSVCAEPLKVLFIGNSYTGQNNLAGVIQRMAVKLPEPVIIEVKTHTPGGCTLEKHAANTNALQKLTDFKPQFVVLQEQSQMPVVHPERTYAAGRKLHATIKDAGAETVFYMTWARAHLPDMINGLAEVYLGLGKELNARVAPVGLAWKQSLNDKPEWPLHKKDKSHPNAHGSYLAACVILATLSDADVAALPDEGFGLKGISAEQAAYFQTLAMQAEHAEPTGAETK